MEEIKTQFVALMGDIIDISEKCSKMNTKDIDTMFTNVVQLNKKNVMLKKIYDLEGDISKLRVLITKTTLAGAVGGAGDSNASAVEATSDTDPVDDKIAKKKNPVDTTSGKVGKSAKKKEEDSVATPVAKPSKKKEEDVVPVAKSVEKKEEEVSVPQTAKSTKATATKKKKEDTTPETPVEVEIPVAAVQTPEEKEADDTEQPLHIRRKKIPKQIKTLVWNEYIGNDIVQNKCLCCKKEKIDMRNFHCGHVIAENKGGDLTIKNLRPICAPCNLSMGTMSMNEFTKTFFGWEV